MANPFVLIGTPCYGGLVTHLYLQSVLRLMVAPRQDLRLGLITAAHDSLITRARNSIVANFLDTADATHLMFIDADIGFEPEAFQRLFRLNEDVVAGRYPVKVRDWAKIRELVQSSPDAKLESAGLHYVGEPCRPPELETRDGFCTGTYAGTGFLLLTRAAILRMIEAHPETKYKSMQTFPRPKTESDNQYNLFDCMIDPATGAYLSEDFTFCHRWRKIGGKLWLDTQSKLVHVGSHEFHGEPLVNL